ncbi:MAG: aminoglycoside phosphotransferase family protein [Acidipropionibacterium jensenii]|nr:aminoglycoside phosphotransferase family protein [Acidipropionibacterium jensenii]
MGLGWVDDAAFALGTELSVKQVLREGIRTTVARCWVDGPTTATGGARTVVAKCFRSRAMSHNSGGYGAVREWAGLAAVPGAPRLLAADLDHGVVVMEDLGSVPTLADLLAGDDGDAALEAAWVWGRSSAHQLTASREAVSRFSDLVRQADPGTLTAGGPASPRLPERGAARLSAMLRLPGPACQRLDEEVALLAGLDGVEGSRVCSQADPAPDNLLVTGDGWVKAIDYEAASYHHIAVDLVSLLTPWPASGLLAGTPGEFQAAVMSGFGTAHGGLADLLDDPDLDPMTGLAAMSTALQMTELTLEPLTRREDVGRFSGGRSRLITLWRSAAEHAAAVTRTMAGACEQAADTAAGTWGWPEELPLYPCFDGRRDADSTTGSR